MYHCHKRNKGVLDRQFVTQSVVFRKDMCYQRVLEKCVSMVFPDDEDVDCEYYVANGKELPICTGECIIIDNDEQWRTQGGLRVLEHSHQPLLERCFRTAQ